MAWFGILSGTAINFLSVYCARLGGSGFQIGMLAATSAFVNLILAMPASRVFQKRPVGRTVFWTSVLYRIGYLLWIPLPWLFARQGQIWALIGITLLMGIPLAVQAIGFNALFAAAVPTEWRASVAGTRNVLYSVAYMLSALENMDNGPAPFVVLDLLRTFTYTNVVFKERSHLLNECLEQLDRLAESSGGLVSVNIPNVLCQAERELQDMIIVATDYKAAPCQAWRGVLEEVGKLSTTHLTVQIK